jgi:hypothetical protein
MIRKLVTPAIPIFVMSIILMLYCKRWGMIFPTSYMDSVIISLVTFSLSLIIDIYIIDKRKSQLPLLTYRRIGKYTLIVGLMYLIGGNISTVLMFLTDFQKNFVFHIIICYLIGLLLSKLILYGIYRS